MKSYNLIVALLFLLLNLLAGYIITSYEWINVGLTSVVILVNFIYMYIADVSHLSDGFRIGLTYCTWFFTVAEFFLGIFSPSKIEDNYVILVMGGLFILQMAIFFTVKQVNNIDQK
ncbi:MAG: hypothetical protein LIP09_15010 [Bacteroidales bacterium]|nr:hypothetical protein [Bacteroidales bacterium]